ncbi:VOC family protein [Cellulomonas carbonis]|uniref:Glyoxalase n=1 Tax=Cellulomonas carbonis T26 TaxID=947969 RepID=A0A0A0BXE3_9CELL|nr:glyoxalase [Cellulomonas carbonis T26]
MACRITELVLDVHDPELERLLAAGARPVDIGQTGDESWHVLADPEGNEFCLPRRRVAPV